MSKDMNVTIWPIWQSGVDDTEYADIGKQWPANVGYYMYAKRLTDTELAAEYWLSSSRKERMLGYGDGYGSATYEQSQIEWDRMETINRFAILPHASDNDYA